MHRRHFLKLLGAAMAGTFCTRYAAGGNESVRTPGRKRIVVVGAGLAGLAAARQLRRQGHDVEVVEARDRIGGRIWTSPKWADLPLDLGATWIHGVKGNPLSPLADEIKAARIVTRYESAQTYNTQGQPLSKTEESLLARLTARMNKTLVRAQDGDVDVSVQQALEPLFNQYAPASPEHRFLRFALNSYIEQEYAGSAAELSAYWYDSDEEFGGGDVLFANGYDVIADLLAKDLDVSLNQPVHEIQWGPTSVRVLTQAGEREADQVVVTLPLGVLQAQGVRFTPDLPPAKRNAIARLGMGVLNKCSLRFPEAFWPDHVDWLEYVPAAHGEWAEWVSFQPAARLPILLGFNAADQGRTLEKWPDAQIAESAMQTLKTMFGSGIPDPVDFQITRWASDPFARGSYSFNALGSTPRMRTDLAAALDARLFFAGEATHKEYFGTAHGAYLSGLRAAREVHSA